MVQKALILVEGSRGNGQLYVQAAKRLGLYPITLAADPSQYDYLAAEPCEAIRVDTSDLNALIRECSRLRATCDVTGITGFPSRGELGYVTVVKLCRHFGLPGPNPERIEQCSDKSTQRHVLQQAGIPVPAFRVAADMREVESAAAEIGLPVILKPAEGSGSRGVRLCRNFRDLSEHASNLFDGERITRSTPRILIEEFAQGPFYEATTMGRTVIAVGAAEFVDSPHFVPCESMFPAPLTGKEQKRIADISQSCLRALGLGWGPTNIEYRWTKRGPVVIEVNARLPGWTTPRLIQLAYGVDLVTAHIKLLIGDECDLRAIHSHTAAARFLIRDRDGIIDRIEGTGPAAAVPGVADVKFYLEPNMPIVRKGDYRDMIGHVIANSPSRAETDAILKHAVGLINWSFMPFAPADV
ncbi:biotin carboxylase protein (plasmid) [Rhizobium etli bv. mimosae str. IE4771]|uniref:Biotin carboxylase protein n=1 Tax=Rhizobium etli bv. mimosae str. IE4771 TaxID=1432050 RepID=A0A060ID20_RHIET|nr:acetyl-CoA carboxylase biotin carboxylase subunit family protein [Rhizobium sp. IE4771]AIC29965.1 biotin carboxylase protein [Rhizobium sp. IE4771]